MEIHLTQFAAEGQNESEAGGFAIKSLLLHTVYWGAYMLTQHCNTVSKWLQVLLTCSIYWLFSWEIYGTFNKV